MKPVDMLWTHNPELGLIGDCFRACVASILELDPFTVPNFCEEDWGKEKDFSWYKAMLKWLHPRGLTYFDIQVPAEFHGRWFEGPAASGFETFHILSGISPRGIQHSVVARNGIIVHDPHPSRAGLAGPAEDGWSYGFFLLRGVTVRVMPLGLGETKGEVLYVPTAA